MLLFAMSNLEYILHNWTTPSQPIQATNCYPGHLLILRIIFDLQTNDNLIAENSCSPASLTATAGNPEVDLTEEAL